MVPVIHDLCYRTLGQYAAHLNIALMPPGWIELPASNALTGARQWVEIINERACLEAKILVRDGNIIAFNQEFLADPNGYPWLGLIRLHPSRDVSPEFHTIIKGYTDLISRVNYRVLNALDPVDYSAARGTAAQLVTSQCMNESAMVEVWSNRHIDKDAIVCGALFRFGHGLAELDASHSRDFQCMESVVDVAGLLQCFLGNVTTRLR